MEMHKNCMEEGCGTSRTVKQLMGLKKATPTVLFFLAATRAAQRAQRQEEEMRWQERERDEAWGLDVDRLEEDDNRVAEEEMENRQKREEGREA